MVGSRQTFPSPMATPLSKSSVASTAPGSPTRSSTKTVRNVQFESDLRKFKITCPNDPNIFVILNTHVDDGGAVLTWRSKYEDTLQALRNRYPGELDSTPMDRYLGMGFSYNPDTGAMTASMYHSIVKLLATFRASSLPVQRTPYTMDLFDPSDDLTPVDEKIYQKLVGMLIWTLKLRFETQLAVIMACSHNSNPTQGDQTKVIRLLAYFSGCQDLGPTWFTTEGPIQWVALPVPLQPSVC